MGLSNKKYTTCAVCKHDYSETFSENLVFRESVMGNVCNTEACLGKVKRRRLVSLDPAEPQSLFLLALIPLFLVVYAVWRFCAKPRPKKTDRQVYAPQAEVRFIRTDGLQ